MTAEETVLHPEKAKSAVTACLVGQEVFWCAEERRHLAVEFGCFCFVFLLSVRSDALVLVPASSHTEWESGVDAEPGLTFSSDRGFTVSVWFRGFLGWRNNSSRELG